MLKKIIILPNNIFNKGVIFFYNIYNFFNFYDILFFNGLSLKKECGGFGKCKTCSFFLLEGYDNVFLFKGFNISCQLKKIERNIIISL